MCGRFVLTSPAEALRSQFGLRQTPDLVARYNIAPTQPIAIVRLEAGVPRWALARWGFVPAWVEDPAAFTLLVNARSESAAAKPAFRNAMRHRRCLMPADGFYEWRRQGARSRPFYFRPRGGGPIAFAGLWETWSGPNGEEVDTAAILTTAANGDVAAVHARMPVILPPDAYARWLDCARVDVTVAAALLVPAPDGTLEGVAVSGAVNRIDRDGPELIVAATEEPVGDAVPARLKRRAKGSAPPGQGRLF